MPCATEQGIILPNTSDLACDHDLTDILYHRHRDTIASLRPDPVMAGLGDILVVRVGVNRGPSADNHPKSATQDRGISLFHRRAAIPN
jgi:hypothetical protein